MQTWIPYLNQGLAVLLVLAILFAIRWLGRQAFDSENGWIPKLVVSHVDFIRSVDESVAEQTEIARKQARIAEELKQLSKLTLAETELKDTKTHEALVRIALILRIMASDDTDVDELVEELIEIVKSSASDTDMMKGKRNAK